MSEQKTNEDRLEEIKKWRESPGEVPIGIALHPFVCEMFSKVDILIHEVEEAKHEIDMNNAFPGSTKLNAKLMEELEAVEKERDELKYEKVSLNDYEKLELDCKRYQQTILDLIDKFPDGGEVIKKLEAENAELRASEHPNWPEESSRLNLSIEELEAENAELKSLSTTQKSIELSAIIKCHVDNAEKQIKEITELKQKLQEASLGWGATEGKLKNRIADLEKKLGAVDTSPEELKALRKCRDAALKVNETQGKESRDRVNDIAQTILYAQECMKLQEDN